MYKLFDTKHQLINANLIHKGKDYLCGSPTPLFPPLPLHTHTHCLTHFERLSCTGVCSCTVFVCVVLDLFEGRLYSAMSVLD